jgi:thioredoxin-dependent peroxiredoxin
MAEITIGSAAPDFELPDQSGAPVKLSGLRGRNVVLFFYPKDDTTGCTIEAGRFRDDIEKFTAAGAEVIGVSDDSSESHARFRAKYQLPFALLSDKGGRVRKLYGVKKTFGVIPGRVTFVIDPEGIVRHVFSSQSKPAKHVEEALAILGGLH